MGRSKNNYTLVIVGLMLSCWVANCRNALSNSKCKLRRYTHNAVQIDFNGLRCWDEVEIMSCWGYCLSHEVRLFSTLASNNWTSICI